MLPPTPAAADARGAVVNVVPVTHRRCLNLNNDLVRYRLLIISHGFDGVLFLTRFILICTALSAAPNNDAVSLLVSALMFELLGGFSVFVANILYVGMTYAGNVLFETDHDKVPYCPRRLFLRFATLTCFTCDCYYEHPHAILLTRVAILIGFAVCRFIAFILGATCAARYPPSAIAYTVIAAVSFIPAIFTIVLEFYHQRRPWQYYPDGKPQEIRKRPPHNLFLPYSIINDQRTTIWRSSLCKRGESCKSQNLYHILLYHSSSTNFRSPHEGDNQVLIGFHQTTQEAAFQISKHGFIASANGMLGRGVYFTPCIAHTEFKAHHKGAYICARVDLGKTLYTTTRMNADLDERECDTVYYRHDHESDEFSIRRPEDPKRIIEWIIVVNQDQGVQRRGGTIRAADPLRDDIKDHFYGETYQGCIL